MALIEVDELGKLEAKDVVTTSETLIKGKKAGELNLKRIATGVSSPQAFPMAADVKPFVMPTRSQRLWGGICTNINSILAGTISAVLAAVILAWWKLF